ncbi:hypothetical protein BKA70DRAFT_1330396 [Coprinopsis sp. MPI-PUGE-AT-0042]|nr:hypothetical protein BKA70DRAFT_1330396 [Coprinopsis sp. MPI-PUGE-AT-0042]
MGDHHSSPVENKCLEAVEMAKGVCSERKECIPLMVLFTELVELAFEVGPTAPADERQRILQHIDTLKEIAGAKSISLSLPAEPPALVSWSDSAASASSSTLLEPAPCLSLEETFEHSTWSTAAATSLPSLELVVDNPWDDVHGAQIAEELEGSSLATKEEPVAAFPPPNSPQLPSIATEVRAFEQRWRSSLFYFICFLLALCCCGVFSNNLALIRQVLV